LIYLEKQVEYVHRIGRTARAGADGDAVSFCSARERDYLREIEKMIHMIIPVVRNDSFYSREAESAVGAAAAKYSAETGAKMEDAYEYGYKVIMDPKQLIEEGKLQGLAQAQNSIPTEGAASGGSANVLGEIELTSQQKTWQDSSA